jgi:hypothetical protein
VRAAAAAAALALVLAGCGGNEPAAPRAGGEEATGARAGAGSAAPGRESSEGTARRKARRDRARDRERPRVRRARCPAGLANCATATGRVIYVEAVDPDGDGDAHYVLLGGDITFPGISVIDVRKDLRPRRLPEEGDWVSAAGPVYRGSYGQRQIEAVVVHHER